MPPVIKTDARQLVHRDLLDQLTTASAHAASVLGGKRADSTQLDDLLTAVNSDLTVPARISANDPADLVLTLDGSVISNTGTSRNRSLYPIDGSVPDFAGGTITFPATSAGNITPSIGSAIPVTTSNGQFNKLGIYINSANEIVLVEGTEGATPLISTAPLEQPGMTYIGYVDFGVDGGGNITDSSSVVGQVINSDIYQYVNASGAGLSSVVNQDRSVKMIGGGNWNWDGANLSWDANAYIQIPGMLDDRNTIDPTFGAQSPVAVGANQVAYVSVNRIDPGVATDLTVSVVNVDAYVHTNDNVIIARRDGIDIVVGTGSFRLISGETRALDASASNENLALLGSGVDESTALPEYSLRGAPERTIDDTQAMLDAMASMDTELDNWFGQLRLQAHPVDPHRATITGVDFTMKDGSTLSKELSSLVTEFTGAIINFDTGEILEDDDVTPLGTNFTPTVIPVSDYHWYSVALVPSSQNVATNTMQAQVLVLPATATDPVAADAPYAPFGGTVRLGQIQVQNVAGTITVGSIRQLGIGSGSGTATQDRNAKMIGGGTWSMSTPSAVPTPFDNGVGANTISTTTNINDAIAQSFIATGNTIESFSTNALSKNGGAATRLIRGYIYTVDGSGLPDVLVATSTNTIDISTLDIDAGVGGVPYTPAVFNFSGEALTPGAEYVAVINKEAGIPPVGWMNVYADTTDPIAPLTFSVSAFGSGGGPGTYTEAVGFAMNLTTTENVQPASELSWTDNAYIQVPGMADDRNRIDPTFGAQSPVTVGANQVAYVDINRIDPGVATDLSVSVVDVDTFEQGEDRFVIARRDGADIIVGTNSFRLISGETRALDASASNENLTLLGVGVTEATALPEYSNRGAPERTIDDSQGILEAMSSMDTELDKWFGQLRLQAHPTDVHRATITGVDLVMKDGTVLSKEMSFFISSFTGAIINFDTGEILEDDDLTPLGVDFTPAVIPVGEYCWYSVALIPGVTDPAANSISAQMQVVPAASTNASAALAPYATFVGSVKIGQVQVQNDAGTITVGAIRQLGIGSGGGGSSFKTVEVSANFTASSDDDVLCDASGGSFTVTLPDAPIDGSRVRVKDATSDFDINSVFIATTDGSTIENLAQPFELDVEKVWAEFVFTASTNNWSLYSPLVGDIDWRTGVITANYTATNDDELMCDTSGGSFTVSLPDSAGIGDGTRVRVKDLADTFNANNLLIATTDGSTIEGTLSPLSIDEDGAWAEFVWMSTINDWRMFTPIVGGGWQSLVIDNTDSPWAALDEQEIFADTSGGAITIDLEVSPSLGRRIRVIDNDGSWGITNVTVNGNGNNINGSPTLVLNVSNGWVELVFNGTEWRVLG